MKPRDFMVASRWMLLYSGLNFNALLCSKPLFGGFVGYYEHALFSKYRHGGGGNALVSACLKRESQEAAFSLAGEGNLAVDYRGEGRDGQLDLSSGVGCRVASSKLTWIEGRFDAQCNLVNLYPSFLDFQPGVYPRLGFQFPRCPLRPFIAFPLHCCSYKENASIRLPVLQATLVVPVASCFAFQLQLPLYRTRKLQSPNALTQSGSKERSCTWSIYPSLRVSCASSRVVLLAPYLNLPELFSKGSTPSCGDGTEMPKPGAGSETGRWPLEDFWTKFNQYVAEMEKNPLQLGPGSPPVKHGTEFKSWFKSQLGERAKAGGAFQSCVDDFSILLNQDLLGGVESLASDMGAMLEAVNLDVEAALATVWAKSELSGKDQLLNLLEAVTTCQSLPYIQTKSTKECVEAFKKELNAPNKKGQTLPLRLIPVLSGDKGHFILLILHAVPNPAPGGGPHIRGVYFNSLHKPAKGGSPGESDIASSVEVLPGVGGALQGYASQSCAAFVSEARFHLLSHLIEEYQRDGKNIPGIGEASFLEDKIVPWLQEYTEAFESIKADSTAVANRIIPTRRRLIQSVEFLKAALGG